MSKPTLSTSRLHTDSVCNFIQKTYQILQSKQNQHIICWSSKGNSFIVKNMLAFSNNILPKYFKHSNFSSFVRQLNMYNFHKVRGDKQENEFEHPKFKRGHRDLLSQIRRKGNEASTQSIPEGEKEKGEEKSDGVKEKNLVSHKSKQEIVESGDVEEPNRHLERLIEENKKLKREKNKLAVLRKQLIDAESYIDDKFFKMVSCMVAHRVKQKMGISKVIRQQEHIYSLKDYNSIIRHMFSSQKPLSFDYYDVYSKMILDGKRDEAFMLSNGEDEREVIPSIAFIAASQGKIE